MSKGGSSYLPALLAAAGFARKMYYAGSNPKTLKLARPKRKGIRRRTRKRRKSRRVHCKPKNALKCQVQKLMRFKRQQEATHIHRRRTFYAYKCNAGQSALYDNDEGGSLARHEAAMANLRYFDPATNTVGVHPPSGGTYQRDIRFSIFRKATFINNYQVPVKLRVYKCHPKDATNISATTAVTNGLTDQGNPTSTSLVVYPTDSKELTQLYKVTSKNFLLQPGQIATVTDFQKEFSYDFALADTHNEAYQKNMGGFLFMWRIEGIVGHDTTLLEFNNLDAGVDGQFDTVYRFVYDAGKDLHDVSVYDNGSSFTNLGVVSSKPVSNNLGYSVA